MPESGVGVPVPEFDPPYKKCITRRLLKGGGPCADSPCFSLSRRSWRRWLVRKQETGTLQAAAQALGANDLKSIEYSGTGKWFQFGQAPSPTLPWPAFDVSSFTASVNYETPAARVQMVRIQMVEPGRVRPAPVQQRPVQVVSGTYAWNMATPAGRRARHRARAAAAGRGRRRADDGDLGDAARLPEGGDGEQRDDAAGRAAVRTSPSPWTGSTSTSAGSTRRTRWSASRPGSTTPSSATRPSRSPTPTTATSTA